MQTPLQIVFRGVDRSEALETRIRDNAAKLELFHPRIMSCHVTVDEAHRHHRQGREFGVRIDVRAPGHEEAVSTLQHHEDVYVAVRDAFDAVRRQLQDEVREARGDVKVHDEPQHGRIARLYGADGCGFIETADGRELYFSRENVVHPAFEDLVGGEEVQFIEEIAAEGAQAKRVSVGKHHFY